MSELLKSGCVGKNKTQKQILAAWEKTGLLQGLKGSMKIYIANAMERGATLILTGRYGTEWKYDILFFPIIRRTMTLFKSKEYFFLFGKSSDPNKREKIKLALKNFDVEYVINSMNENIPKFESLITNMNHGWINNLDIEAEICSYYTQMLARGLSVQYRYTDVFKKSNGKLLLFNIPTNEY